MSSHRFVCYNCDKWGHVAKDCSMPKKKHDKKPNNMLAFNAALNEYDEEAWILDSGASMYMTFKSDLTSVSSTSLNTTILLN